MAGDGTAPARDDARGSASGPDVEDNVPTFPTALADRRSTAIGRYRDLLRRPAAAHLFGASIIARLPTGMMGLGWIFLVREFSSYSSAGMVLAVFAVSSGIAVVGQGRLIDRLGQTRVLAVCAAAFPLGLGLSIFAATRSWLPGVIAAAVTAGLTMPAVAACLRALFPRLVGDSSPLLRTAYGLDNALQEALYLIGPLLVAWLATTVHMYAPMIVGAGRAARTGWSGPLRSPSIRVIVAATFLFGLSFGLLYLSVPALLDDLAARGTVGFAFAAIAGGTICSSLWFGGLKWQVDSHVAFVGSLGLLAMTIGVSALASSPWQLVFFMGLVGLAEGPRVASASQLVGRLSPPAATTEAFTWLNAATVGGSATGLVAAGALLALLAPAELLVLSAVVSAGGALFAFVRRGVLSA
jgi:MFS family permease